MLSATRNDVRYLSDRWKDLRRRWNLLFRQSEALPAPAMKHLDPRQGERWQRLWRVSTLALHEYKPAGSLAVPTTLFTATPPLATGPTDMPLDDVLGWRTWIRARLEPQALHGDHSQVFSPENIDLIARVIARAISTNN